MTDLKRLFILVAAFVATTAFVACNDDNDIPENEVRSLTEAEKMAYRQAVNGNYVGYLVFQHPDSIKPDSIEVAWTIDMISSKLTVNKFPVNFIANYAQPEKQLLNAAGPQLMKADIAPFLADYAQYIDNYIYRYEVLPENKKMMFTYDTKNVVIDFNTHINGYDIINTAYGTYMQPMSFINVGVYQDDTFVCNIIFDQLTVGYTIYPLNFRAVLSGKKTKQPEP